MIRVRVPDCISDIDHHHLRILTVWLGALQVAITYTGSAAFIKPIKLRAFLLTERHQNTLAPMLFHKLVGGSEWPKPKKPPNQGKGAAHRNLENLKGVTVREATFQVTFLSWNGAVLPPSFLCSCFLGVSLLTEHHQNTRTPMLSHKLVGGPDWPKPKMFPSHQGKETVHQILENLKGVTFLEATFQVTRSFE
jgi:hypothetical protein